MSNKEVSSIRRYMRAARDANAEAPSLEDRFIEEMGPEVAKRETLAGVGEVDWEERKLAARVIRRTAELLASLAEEGEDAADGLDLERLDRAYLRHWEVLKSFVQTFDAGSWASEDRPRVAPTTDLFECTRCGGPSASGIVAACADYPNCPKGTP